MTRAEAMSEAVEESNDDAAGTSENAFPVEEAKRPYRTPRVRTQGVEVSLAVLTEVVARVRDRIHEEPMSGCWLWAGSTAYKGYGQIWLPGGRRTMAHRAVYQVAHGVLIPRELVLDHHCRNSACVNPAHPEVVTAEENTRRGAALRLRIQLARNAELGALL